MRKQARQRGLEYVNTVGNLIPEKTMLAIDCSCTLNCSQNERVPLYRHTFDHFKSIGNKQTQDTYLVSLIFITVDETRISRAKQITYNIRTSGALIQVCKSTFLAVHAITKSRVERICDLVFKNNFAPRDLRGTHVNRPNQIPDDIKKQVHRHINSIPRRRSHYGGDKTLMHRYLSPELNVKKLHSMYMELHEPTIFEGIQKGLPLKPLVTYDYYLRYFNENFKLSFGSPRTDTCKTCDNYLVKLDSLTDATAKNQLNTEWTDHKITAEKFYTDLNKTQDIYKKSNNVLVICMDFQQNIPLPTLTTSEQFYARLLWLFSFCIYR